MKLVRPGLSLLILSVLGFGSDEPRGPSFEVASIKPKRDPQLVAQQCGGRRFSMSFRSVFEQIAWSYGMPYNRVVGVPAWASEYLSGYLIEATSATPLDLDQCRAMTRTLLADRFRMTHHMETRTADAFALVLTDNGKKLAAAAKTGARHAKINDQMIDWEENGLTMATLASLLGNHPGVGLPVIDKTGLAGRYVFELIFFTREGETGDRPLIFTALKEQLGMKLEAVKIPLEFMVVDHVERPTEN
jgi:uncharacterized protein (TIGR03435 family)